MKYKVKRSRAGLGLFACDTIKKGERIIEYTGKILSNKEVYEKGGKYLFELNKRKTIDGSGRENIARYLNHACKPNTEACIERGRVFIYAIRNINIGDEIAYNYGKEYIDEYIKPYGCKCRACYD